MHPTTCGHPIIVELSGEPDIVNQYWCKPAWLHLFKVFTIGRRQLSAGSFLFLWWHFRISYRLGPTQILSNTLTHAGGNIGVISFLVFPRPMDKLFSWHFVPLFGSEELMRVECWLPLVGICGSLVITGNRSTDWWKHGSGNGHGNGGVYHRQELAQGPYRAVWRLPKTCDTSAITAEFM